MNQSMRLLSAVGLALSVASGAHASFITTIDNYSSGGFTLSVDYTNAPLSTQSTLSQSGLAQTIGGNRTSTLTYLGAPTPDVDPGDRSRLRVVALLNGSLSLSTDNGVTPSVEMNYGSPLFNMNADLAAGGATGIAINFIRNDQVMPVTITLYSAFGTGSQSSSTLTLNAIASNSAFQTYFDFAAFSLLGGPGLNLGDIDRIDVLFAPQTGGDFSADGIGTIPTPGAFALLGLGGLVAGRRRR